MEEEYRVYSLKQIHKKEVPRWVKADYLKAGVLKQPEQNLLQEILSLY